MAPLLSELFETFHRLCVYKHKENSNLSELSSTHLMVALYSYFHRSRCPSFQPHHLLTIVFLFRLYGMFPCNFLSSLRQQDYDTSCSGVFTGNNVRSQDKVQQNNTEHHHQTLCVRCCPRCACTRCWSHTTASTRRPTRGGRWQIFLVTINIFTRGAVSGVG